MNEEPRNDESQEQKERAKARAEQRIMLEKEAPQEPRVGETGRRHPTVAPGTAPPGGSDDEEYTNHSRSQGIAYGRGSSEGPRNDHLHNSTDDDR